MPWRSMIGPLLYVLDANHEPVPADSPHAWTEWMSRSLDNESRVVAQDQFDGFVVTTIFTGVNHAQRGHVPKGLYETIMVNTTAVRLLHGKLEGPWRYDTWDEAQLGHQLLVARLRPSNKDRKNGRTK